MTKQNVYVVGGGISGIGASYYLKQHQMVPILIERAPVIGGRAGCEQVGDNIFEVGGKNFNLGGKLSQEILSAHQIDEFDDQHPSFPFMVNGKMYILGKRKEIGRTLYSLIRSAGFRGCYQFIKFMEYIGKHRHDLKYGSVLMQSIEDQYDDQPLSHHFSLPLAYGALRMFSIILCGTEPEETYCSTLMAALSEQQGASVSIHGGINRLFERVLNGQEVMLNTTVRKVVVKRNAVTGLVLSNNGRDHEVPADQVVLSVPAHALNQMFDLPPDVARDADAVRYSPLILAVAKYHENVFNNKFSSIFFDRSYHLGHVSASRAYEKNVIRYTFSGKKGRKVFQKEDHEVMDLAERELFTTIQKVRQKPVTPNRLVYKVYRYDKGVCSYGARFSRLRRRLLDYFSSIRGLALAGDYFNGHNMEGCLSSSKAAVDHLIQQQSVM